MGLDCAVGIIVINGNWYGKSGVIKTGSTGYMSDTGWLERYELLKRSDSGARGIISSVTRAIDILETLATAPSPVTAAQVSATVGLPVGTVHRIINTLIWSGWVEKRGRAQYAASMRIPQLADGILSHLDLREIARDVIKSLSHDTGLTSYLAVPSGLTATCIERVESSTVFPIMIWNVGAILPLYAGAAPTAILAYLPEARVSEILPPGTMVVLPVGTRISVDVVYANLSKIRERGYSVSENETVPCVTSIGAPIFDLSGRIIGAISVGMLSVQSDARVPSEVSSRVMAAGRQISESVGFDGQYPCHGLSA